MLPQRVIFGIGLAVLLVISAASISLDVKARSDAAWVARTLEVMNKISETRLLMRRAESSARGFALNGATNFLTEFQDVKDRIGPAFATLRQQFHDNPEQLKRINAAEEIAEQRLAISTEMMEKKKIGDIDGINTMFASAGGRAYMQQLNEQFDGMI